LGREGARQNTDMVEMLVRSGRCKERYVMRKKDESTVTQLPLGLALPETEKATELPPETAEGEGTQAPVLILEEGRLIPFAASEYTPSTLYERVEAFSVECRMVRPDDPGHVIFEGKKPSRKTIPVIVKRDGESVLLDSWESLEARPEQLADAVEVLGVTAVKQVFVLRRK